MANIKSAMKRAKTNAERRLRNRYYRSTIRTFIKKTNDAIANGDKESSQTYFTKVCSYADRLVGKSILHKNNAARIKSRLQKKINAV